MTKQNYWKYANSYRGFAWMMLGLLVMALAFMICSVFAARGVAIVVGYVYVAWLVLYYVLAWFRWRKYVSFKSEYK